MPLKEIKKICCQFEWWNRDLILLKINPVHGSIFISFSKSITLPVPNYLNQSILISFSLSFILHNTIILLESNFRCPISFYFPLMFVFLWIPSSSSFSLLFLPSYHHRFRIQYPSLNLLFCILPLFYGFPQKSIIIIIIIIIIFSSLFALEHYPLKICYFQTLYLPPPSSSSSSSSFLLSFSSHFLLLLLFFIFLLFFSSLILFLFHIFFLFSSLLFFFFFSSSSSSLLLFLFFSSFFSSSKCHPSLSFLLFPPSLPSSCQSLIPMYLLLFSFPPLQLILFFPPPPPRLSFTA